MAYMNVTYADDNPDSLVHRGCISLNEIISYTIRRDPMSKAINLYIYYKHRDEPIKLDNVTESFIKEFTTYISRFLYV